MGGGGDITAWLAVGCTRGGIKIIAYRRAKPRSPATSFEFQRTINAHEGAVAYKMVLDQPGDRLASCGGDGRVRVWQVEDLISEENSQQKAAVHCMVQLGPDMLLLVRENRLEFRSWEGSVIPLESL